jgi:hypothetical protein
MTISTEEFSALENCSLVTYDDELLCDDDTDVTDALDGPLDDGMTIGTEEFSALENCSLDKAMLEAI